MSRPPRFPRNEIVSLLEVGREFNLAESTIDDLRTDELLALVGTKRLGDVRLGYGPLQGSEELRNVVAEMVGLGPDDIIATTGAQLGLALLAMETCRAGDEVVLAAPYFPPSLDLFAGMGAIVRRVALEFDKEYRIDPQEIAALLSPATRLVSFASPQNPSGVTTPVEVISELLALLDAQAPDALLFVDETYREAAYGSDTASDSVAAMDPRIITASSLSKAHGAAGLRVGWLTVRDPMLRERLLSAKMNLVISGSPLNEALAAALLAKRDRFMPPRRAVLADALAILVQWRESEARRLDWVRPDAGGLCCMKLKPSEFSDEAVDRFWRVLPDLELQLGDGRWFGEAARIVRVGFGYLPLSTLPRALGAFSNALDLAQGLATASESRR